MIGPPPHPAPPNHPWRGFAAVSVGSIMSTLDGSIVNVTLPTLRQELGASFGGVEWVVATYLLVISATLLAAGRLGDLFGHRRMYVGGLLLFTVGSGACGLASSLAALVAARALQALGATAMMAMGPAIVTALFPLEQRGRALGAVATVVALGLTMGPPLGGLILQHLSWRWVFLPNLPIGVAGAIWASRVLPQGRPRPGARMDWSGAAILAFALVSLVAGLQTLPGGGGGPWGFFAGALAAGALLVRHVRRAASPVLDPGLFRSVIFSAGIAGGLLSYAAMFALNLLTPFYLSGVQGLSARGLGLMLTPVPLALSVASPLSGWLTDRFGGRSLSAAGMVVLAAGLAGLSRAGAGASLAAVGALLATCGLGMGLFQPPNNTAVMSAVPREKLGSGAGMLATARNLGMVLGISSSSAIFRSRGGATSRPEELLRGYGAALLGGAALALLAGATSLLRDRGATAEATREARP